MQDGECREILMNSANTAARVCVQAMAGNLDGKAVSPSLRVKTAFAILDRTGHNKPADVVQNNLVLTDDIPSIIKLYERRKQNARLTNE